MAATTISFSQSITPILMAVFLMYCFIMCIINAICQVMHRKSISPMLERRESFLMNRKVSVLIPARDESENIEDCLFSLVHQTYGNYEILVMDDNSSDNTLEIALSLASAYPHKIRVFKGDPLPSNWYGKCYALHQLYGRASGEIFLLTDADTIHEEESISYAVSCLDYYGMDFFSGYPRQIIRSFSEALTVPSMFVVKLFVPLFMIHMIRGVWCSFAVGQYICLTKHAFNSINGMNMIKKEICEDLEMARLIRRNGMKAGFLPIGSQVSCRMYRSYASAFQGISKAIYPATKKSLLVVFVHLMAVFTTIAPFLIFILALISSQVIFYMTVGVVFTFTFLIIWSLILFTENVCIFYAIFYPLLLINSVVMSIYSISALTVGKGILWKKRLVK